jgi:hypothetical protein
MRQADAEREGGDDGQQRVARGVVDDDAPFREALHARHGDELLMHHFQHVGAHQQERQALQVEGQGQDGQREMMDVVPRGDALPVVGIGQPRTAGTAGGEPAGVERQ